MYVPPAFREEDKSVLAELIRAHPLGLLITSGPGGIVANPVPFILPEDDGPLLAHLARANPQLQELEAAPDVLIVFQGPERYITPSWYATKQESSKVVPTWNYAMVQVRGTARLHDDPVWLRAQVDALTRENEAGRSAPWQVADAPERFVGAQLRGIVGLEVAIIEMAGKWKVSQNRNAADRAGVIEGLRDEGDAEAEAMADLVASRHGP